MKDRKPDKSVLAFLVVLLLIVSGIILFSLHKEYDELIGDNVVNREMEIVESTENIVGEGDATEEQKIRELFGDKIQYQNINSWNLDDVNNELINNLDSIDATPIFGWIHYHWLGGKSLRERNLPKALEFNASYNDEAINSTVHDFFESTCEQVTGEQDSVVPIPYGYDSAEMPVFYQISAAEAITYCDQSKVIPALREEYSERVDNLRALYMSNPDEYSPSTLDANT